MSGIDVSQREAGRPRQFWLDAARALAIVSVTVNHALSRSFATGSGTQAEFLQMSAAGSLLKALLYVFSRLGVPLFLMITGALLLGRNYEDRGTLRRFFRHNWLGLFRTTEIWLFLMFWFQQMLSGSFLRNQGIGRALLECVKTMLFINPTVMGNMWYMEMILVVYAMIPVIGLGVQKLGDRLFLALAAFAAVSSMAMPNLNVVLHALGVRENFYFSLNWSDLFSRYFVYVLAGHWIGRGKLAGIRTGWIWAALAVSFIGTALFQYWVYSLPMDYAVIYADVGVLAASVFLFELIRRGARSGGAAERPVTFLARIAFGIYFTHVCFMTVLAFLMSKLPAVQGWTYFLILAAGSFALSVLFVRLAAKSRRLGRLLFLLREPL